MSKQETDQDLLRRLQEKAGDFRFEPLPPREPDMPEFEIIELPWQETVAYFLVDLWDAYQRAKKIVEARTPKYQRVAKRVLKIVESIIYIAGWFASKRINFFSNIIDRIGGK